MVVGTNVELKKNVSLLIRKIRKFKKNPVVHSYTTVEVEKRYNYILEYIYRILYSRLLVDGHSLPNQKYYLTLPLYLHIHELIINNHICEYDNGSGTVGRFELSVCNTYVDYISNSTENPQDVALSNVYLYVSLYGILSNARVIEDGNQNTFGIQYVILQFVYGDMYLNHKLKKYDVLRYIYCRKLSAITDLLNIPGSKPAQLGSVNLDEVKTSIGDLTSTVLMPDKDTHNELGYNAIYDVICSCVVAGRNSEDLEAPLQFLTLSIINEIWTCNESLDDASASTLDFLKKNSKESFSPHHFEYRSVNVQHERHQWVCTLLLDVWAYYWNPTSTEDPYFPHKNIPEFDNCHEIDIVKKKDINMLLAKGEQIE